MTSVQRLSSGMLWTLLGYVLPTAAALVVIPLLIRQMGPDRFGLLAFVWMIVGYSNFLDLGIGRALTQGIAERLGRGEQDEIPGIIQTGLLMLVILGVAGGVGLSLGSDWISGRFLKVPLELIWDARRSLLLASIAIPLVVVGSALRSVLEGFQRFQGISLVRSSVGVLIYLSALPVLSLTHGVWAIVAMLILVRLVEVGLYASQCRRLVPGMLRRPSFRPSFLKPLFAFGLWSTLNNLVGSFMSMAYADRLLLSSLVGTGALVYFGTPFDMAVRVLVLPTSLVGVLFPALSALGRDSGRATDLVMQAIRTIVFGTAPVFIAMIALAKPLLAVWISPEFSEQSSLIFQLVSAGMFLISISYAPFAYIQAMGRPDLSAKRHLLEIPFYLVASYVGIRLFGAKGSGLVWFLWSIIDLFLIYRIMVGLFVNHSAEGLGRKWVLIAALFGLAFLAGISPSRWAQITAGVSLPLVCLLWGWRLLLQPDDREVFIRWMPWASRLRIRGDVAAR